MLSQRCYKLNANIIFFFNFIYKGFFENNYLFSFFLTSIKGHCAQGLALQFEYPFIFVVSLTDFEVHEVHEQLFLLVFKTEISNFMNTTSKIAITQIHCQSMFTAGTFLMELSIFYLNSWELLSVHNAPNEYDC